MTKYYALIGPKLDGPALNSAMTACSIEPSIRQVPRLYVNRMVLPAQMVNMLREMEGLDLVRMSVWEVAM